jgi:hypothetical protein
MFTQTNAVYALCVLHQVGRKSAVLPFTTAVVASGSSSSDGSQHEVQRAVWARSTLTIHSRCQVSNSCMYHLQATSYCRFPLKDGITLRL